MTKPVFRFVEWDRGPWTLRGAALEVRKSCGPWCIVSHGFTGNHIGPAYLFARLSRCLAEVGVSSLRFDYGGCGDSDGEFREMTIETMKADLLSATEFVQREHAPSALMYLGHSLGGMIAAICAPRAAVQGLALLSPVALPKGLVERRKEMMAAGPNSRGFYENGPHELNPRFLDGLEGIDPPALLATTFKGKLLLMQGGRDQSISVAESNRYVEAARAAGIETVARVLDNADHCYSTVADFTTVCSTVSAWVGERFA